METAGKDYAVVRVSAESAPQCKAGDVLSICWEDSSNSSLEGEVISNDGEYIELLMNDPFKHLRQ